MIPTHLNLSAFDDECVPNQGASVGPGSRASHGAASVSTLPGFDPSRENIAGSLSWIGCQAQEGMTIAAGAATTHGDESGGLRWLHSILSDIAINADLALDAIAMETREGGDAKRAPSRSDDSAAIAQPSPSSEEQN